MHNRRLTFGIICVLFLLCPQNGYTRGNLENVLGEAIKEALALQYGFIDNPLIKDWVNMICNKLSQSANVEVSPCILDTEEINAYATFGNFIFVTKGLLQIVESEDELACVLAHEIAHLKLQHPQKQGKVTILSLGSLSLVKPRAKEKLLLRALLTLLNLRYSRSQEKEADEEGMEIALKSGFNPRGLTNFLKRLGKDKTPRWAEYLATHPSPSHRLEIAKKRLEAISPQEWEGIYLSLWERGEAKEGREFPQFQPPPPSPKGVAISLRSSENISLIGKKLRNIYSLSQRIAQWQGSLLWAPIPYELLPLIAEALAQSGRLKELYNEALLLYENAGVWEGEVMQKEANLDRILRKVISSLDKGKQAGEKLLLSSATLTGLLFSKYTGDFPLLSLQTLLLASAQDIAQAREEIKEAIRFLVPFQIEALVHRLNDIDDEWLRRKCSHRLGIALGKWEGIPLGNLCLLISIAKVLGKPVEETMRLWGNISNLQEVIKMGNLTTKDKEAIYIFLNSLAKGN